MISCARCGKEADKKEQAIFYVTLCGGCWDDVNWNAEEKGKR